MAEKRIVVPEGMLKAVLSRGGCDGSDVAREEDIEAALRWLSENPIVPTEKQIDGMQIACDIPVFAHHGFERICTEWQRRMFLDPEPEEIKDLLMECDTPPGTGLEEVNNRNVIEAFRRGQKSAKS